MNFVAEEAVQLRIGNSHSKPRQALRCKPERKKLYACKHERKNGAQAAHFSLSSSEQSVVKTFPFHKFFGLKV